MTLQTKQLTSAFDKQSRHISDLLTELREKESALHNQKEELQRCKQELDTSKKHKAGDDQRREPRTQKESNTDSNTGPLEISPRSPHTNNQECISDFEAPSSENQLSGFGVKGEVEADATAELHSLCQENQLLQKKLLDFNASKTSTSLIPIEDGNQENQDHVEQNLSSCPAPFILNQQGEPVDVTVGVTSCEESAREDSSIERRTEEGCQTQINRLQQQVLIMSTLTCGKILLNIFEVKESHQIRVDSCTACSLLCPSLFVQVVELKNKLKALSAESQQQAEELAVWRLASQTAPIFDLQDETSILSQPQPVEGKHHETTANPGDLTSSAQPPQAAGQRGCGSVTIVREDELLLSCSTNNLHGHIVFSRYWTHTGSWRRSTLDATTQRLL